MARIKAKLAFEKRHKRYLSHTEKVYLRIAEAREQGKHLPLGVEGAFRRGVAEVYRNRWYCPEECMPAKPPWRSEENPWDNYVPVSMDKAEWQLEDAQIWKPRVAPFVDPSTPNRPKLPWSQTGKYYDTPEHLQQCLESDWAIACEKGIEKLIERHDTAGISMDPSKDVLKVFREHLGFVYSCFDYYSQMGASDDIFHMRLNAYKTLVEESKLANPDMQHCTLTRFDQLFVALTAKSEVALPCLTQCTSSRAPLRCRPSPHAPSSTAPHCAARAPQVARALSRPEWLVCLVQFALMRRVHNEQTDSVEHALRELITKDMQPSVDRRALHDANAFRELMYTQAVTQDGLVDWEPQLKQVCL